MARTAVKCTLSLPCSGLAIDDTDIALSWNTAKTHLVETTNNSVIEGKCEVVDKNLDLCTLEYMGILRFAIADSVTLTAADKGKGIKGAASGATKLVAYSSTYDEDLRGNVVDFSNATGDKWVDVIFTGTS